MPDTNLSTFVERRLMTHIALMTSAMDQVNQLHDELQVILDDARALGFSTEELRRLTHGEVSISGEGRE